MLSTAIRVLGNDEIIKDLPCYRLAHLNHPMTKWIRESRGNYAWAIDLARALHDEWLYRFEHPATRRHKSLAIIDTATHLIDILPFPATDFMPPPMCMPPAFKSVVLPPSDVPEYIQRYRYLYTHADGKLPLASRRLRHAPSWEVTPVTTTLTATSDIPISL